MEPLLELVLATTNEHKLAEVAHILAGIAMVRSWRDFAGAPSPEETGATFAENAIIKATAAAAHTGMLSLADDSGLEVTALQGAPGVLSARYAGPDADAATRNTKLLQALAGVPWPERKARFVCAVALVAPDGTTWTAAGTHEGYILEDPRGRNGFGYDPLFYSPELGKSFAEASPQEKNAVSHRSRALAKLRQHLQNTIWH